GPYQIAPDTMAFPVSDRPTLLFAHAIGNVHIRAGSDGEVSIQAKRHGFLDGIHLHYEQHGNVIHIISDIDSDLPSDTWVDFLVNVPRQAGVRVALQNGGTLEVDGMSGQIDLRNTNGAIWATHDQGSLTTTTDSGSITITAFVGQITAITQNGTITTTNAHLERHTTLQADSGTINFH